MGNRPMRIWKWVAGGLCGLGVLLFLSLVVVRSFVGGFFLIPQNGMYPGLPAGSWVFGWYQPYADVSKVVRGDIIMFERWENSERIIYIWRVIGLPGETVSIDGDRLTINGKDAVREKVHSEGELDTYKEVNGDSTYEVAIGPVVPPDIPMTVRVTVPTNHVFVLGDNRHHAVDSRSFGPIPFGSIVAKKW